MRACPYWIYRSDHELRAAYLEKNKVQSCYEQLIPREKEIMEYVARGKMNKVIAYELDITTRTVELHRVHVMKKMQARSLAELVRYVQALNSES